MTINGLANVFFQFGIFLLILNIGILWLFWKSYEKYRKFAAVAGMEVMPFESLRGYTIIQSVLSLASANICASIVVLVYGNLDRIGNAILTFVTSGNVVPVILTQLFILPVVGLMGYLRYRRSAELPRLPIEHKELIQAVDTAKQPDAAPVAPADVCQQDGKPSVITSIGQNLNQTY